MADSNNIDKQLALFEKEKEMMEQKFMHLLESAKMNAKIDLLTQKMDEREKNLELQFKIKLQEEELKHKEEKLKEKESQHKKDLENERKMATLQSSMKNVTISTPLNSVFPNSFSGSVILDAHQKSILTSWKPGNYQLLYRATTHGASASNFHSCCNNRAGTFVIVRVGTFIFGGYNPITWTSSCAYANTSNLSFLFTLINPYSDGPTMIPCISAAHGIYNNSNYGPTFGSGHDLHIANNCTTNSSSYCNISPTSYANTLGRGQSTFTGSKHFQVSDYEVFTIM